MPLPRFDRLPDAAKAEILAIARVHFARDGNEASYNRIIADAGISKTSAYNYFDGKADLFGAVLADCIEGARRALGDWLPATSMASFWRQLEEASSSLVRHLSEHPEARAVLSQMPAQADADPWTATMIDDAVRWGLVDHGERPLIEIASQAVIDALDRRALEYPETAAETAKQLPVLLARLWRADTP